MCREKSRTSAWLTVWPVSDVPPPRERKATRFVRASSSAACTSAASRGVTMPTGSI